MDDSPEGTAPGRGKRTPRTRGERAMENDGDSSGADSRRPSVLVSRCLLGEAVRYDGGHARLDHPLLARLRAAGRLVPVCPEVAGGLPVPRPPAEISGGEGGDVLAGVAKVRTREGRDVTPAFLAGARAALAAARAAGCRFALLREGSPACGCTRIHDGGFAGRTRPGRGVAAALLEEAGISCFPEERIEALERALEEYENDDSSDG